MGNHFWNDIYPYACPTVFYHSKLFARAGIKIDNFITCGCYAICFIILYHKVAERIGAK